MPRIGQGPVDLLAGYTIIDPDPNDSVENDYYQMGDLTIWGVGLVTFGPPTVAQQTWLANGGNYATLSTFPGDWVSFGFSAYTPGTLYAGPLAIWPAAGWVHGVSVTGQGVKGAESWGIAGGTGN